MFAVMDERGDLVVASFPFKRASYADSETFRHHATDPADALFISRPERGADGGPQSIMLSRRISKPDGSFAGVVSLGLDPTYFSRFYDQVDLGQDAVVVLVGMDGIIRARKKNDDASAGQDLSGFETFKALKSQRAGNFIATRTLDGVRRFFAYRVLEAYPLIVQVGIAEDVMFAAYHRMRAQFVVWAGVITALLALFVALVVTQAARQSRFAAAMQASESRYRSFITATSRIVWGADSTGRVVADSQTWRAYTGQTPERYIEAGWLDAVHPEDRERVGAAWRETIQKKSPCETEFRLRGADESYRTFRCRAVPVMNDDGAVREWVAVLDDLTDMRQAEAAVRASEERLRAILEAEPDCVLLVDQTGRVLEMNRGGVAMLGFAALDELRARPLVEFVGEHERSLVRDTVSAVFRGEASSITFELIGAQGLRRWVQMNSVPLRDSHDGERIIALLGVARDITDQKRTQDELVASRKQQQDILNSIYAFVGLFTLDGILVEANDAPFTATSGHRRDAIGKPYRDAYWWSYSDAVRERVGAALAQAANGGVVRYDEVLRAAEHEYITVDIQFSPLRDGDGRVVQVVAFGVDITERKKAEAERAHLAHIVQTSDDAIISRSLDHIILSWNAGAERLFGYTAEEAIGRETSLIVAPEGMDAYLRVRAMSSAGKPPPPHENDCIAKDGRRLGVWISASAVHDERGEVVAISLILRDITEQKALAAQQRLAASVFESAAEGIMITDCDQGIVAVNRAFTDITGFTAE
ncbi:MAG TPA: PAS domain S-box protein, partial [Burkholderiales bacterium]|nr:PAS domain S-box protein [Burkholderiales bacterium]